MARRTSTSTAPPPARGGDVLDREPVGPDRSCPWFTAGHTVHWIQALHSGRPENADAEWTGAVVAVADGVVHVVTDDGRALAYRTHDLPRLSRARGAAGDAATGNTRFGLLRLAGHEFSVARDTGVALDACPVAEPDRDPERP